MARLSLGLISVDADYIALTTNDDDSNELDYRGHNTGLRGERGLLAALLLRAFEDLRAQNKFVRDSAIRWFQPVRFLDADEWPFTFLTTCEYLGLDPKAIIERLTKVGLLGGVPVVKYTDTCIEEDRMHVSIATVLAVIEDAEATTEKLGADRADYADTVFAECFDPPRLPDEPSPSGKPAYVWKSLV